MKISEIVLKGFKSYGRRTALSDLSPNLSCITGLNGSGKSNILDGICFVLGLQAFSLARVDKLQEFVYKNGQSGITEAHVSLVFDHLGKALKELPGMRKQECMTVTRSIKHGKSKYRLNGRKVTLTAIKRLFKSIGLNMDNPSSFFVKQGTISHIVNFKPRDLLELVEECAGVNYYNTIKRSFDRVLTRQDKKILYVDSIYSGDLQPEMQKLKEEVRLVGEFKQARFELGVLRKNKTKVDSFIARSRIQLLRKTLAELRVENFDKNGQLADENKKILSLDTERKQLVSQESFSKQTGGIESKIAKLEKQSQVLRSEIEMFRESTLRDRKEFIGQCEERLGQYRRIIQKTEVDLNFQTRDKQGLDEELMRKREFVESLSNHMHSSNGRAEANGRCRRHHPNQSPQLD